jgi:predicted MPP superfamily phosphohydrolase
MKFITIGDIHGCPVWKRAVYHYDKNTDRLGECLLGKEIDKVIFIGDYVDDWDLTNIEILDNLHEIIQLKKDYPDNVVLLWGNHDIAYLRNETCSGNRMEMRPVLYYLFKENIDLFQLAYQYKKTIWTHAGIHRGWWEYFIEPLLKGVTQTRFTPFLVLCDNIADQLNLMFEYYYQPLFMVSPHRGGRDKVGGPLWADKIEIYTKPLEGYHQVVGHNPVPYVRTYTFKNGTKLTFCDCLTKTDKFYILDL